MVEDGNIDGMGTVCGKCKSTSRNKVMKVVINSSYGGFDLSQEAIKYIGMKSRDDYLSTKKPRITEDELWSSWKIERHDPKLVDVVEKLGTKSWGFCAQLKVVEIPNGTDYYIYDYDGMETIIEKGHSWS